MKPDFSFYIHNQLLNPPEKQHERAGNSALATPKAAGTEERRVTLPRRVNCSLVGGTGFVQSPLLYFSPPEGKRCIWAVSSASHRFIPPLQMVEDKPS